MSQHWKEGGGVTGNSQMKQQQVSCLQSRGGTLPSNNAEHVAYVFRITSAGLLQEDTFSQNVGEGLGDTFKPW